MVSIFDDEIENLSVVFVCHVLVLLHKVAKFIRKTYGLMSADLPRNFNMDRLRFFQGSIVRKKSLGGQNFVGSLQFRQVKVLYFLNFLNTRLCLRSIEQNSGCTTARGPRGDTDDEEESAKVWEPWLWVPIFITIFWCEIQVNNIEDGSRRGQTQTSEYPDGQNPVPSSETWTIDVFEELSGEWHRMKKNMAFL